MSSTPEQCAKYHRENREKVCERKARYRREHIEKERERGAQSRRQNREQLHENKIKYRRTHLEQIRKKDRERYARRLREHPEWAFEHREQTREWRAQYYREHSEQLREYQLYRRHGLSFTMRAELLDAQGGVCALCGLPPNGKPLVVDHCHATNEIRGLIHSKCNSVLGWAGDDVRLLDLAARYLRRGGGVAKKRVSRASVPAVDQVALALEPPVVLTVQAEVS
jgi:hypothetical protein